MKKIDLGQAITILANVGAIAGIVFLGFELRQNNELMAAQARFNRLSVQTGTATLIAENSELAEILDKNQQGEHLTSVEQMRASAFAERVLANIYWSYREVPESELPLTIWRRVFHDPIFKAAFDQGREDWDPSFTRFVEEKVLHE